MLNQPRTNNSRIRIIGIVIGLLLAAGAAYFFIFRNDPSTPAPSNTAATMATHSQGSNSEPQDQTELTGSPEDTSPVYTDPDYGFSFDRPDGFTVTRFQDEKGDVVLAQGPANQTFQIFISPFDEEGPITSPRIKQDLPKMLIQNPIEAEIGGVPALVFFSNKESLAKTREVWFVYPENPLPNGNQLYQVSAPGEFDQELSKIMATWKFQ